jgi:hypothetical protein
MIDLINYETWFLLYADNELTAEERKAVELFVRQHPSIQQEFNGILDMRFSPDAENSKFNKALLHSNIMEKRFQKMLNESELLLDHIDGELSSAKTKELNLRLDQDAHLLASYNALLQLKLEPDETVVYTNKDELYRHHQPALYGWRWPMAIAASLLFLTGLFWITKTENTVAENPVQVIAKDEQRNSPIDNSSSKESISIASASVKVLKLKKNHRSSLVSNQENSKPNVDQGTGIQQIQYEPVIEESAVIFTDEKPIAENVRSNNLPIQQSAGVFISTSQQTVNAEPIMVNAFDELPAKNGRKPFKQLFRKISRVLGKEREESDQIKFIQVANIQFAVSKQ